MDIKYTKSCQNTGQSNLEANSLHCSLLSEHLRKLRLGRLTLGHFGGWTILIHPVEVCDVASC